MEVNKVNNYYNINKYYDLYHFLRVFLKNNTSPLT